MCAAVGTKTDDVARSAFTGAERFGAVVAVPKSHQIGPLTQRGMSALGAEGLWPLLRVLVAGRTNQLRREHAPTMQMAPNTAVATNTKGVLWVAIIPGMHRSMKGIATQKTRLPALVCARAIGRNCSLTSTLGIVVKGEASRRLTTQAQRRRGRTQPQRQE